MINLTKAELNKLVDKYQDKAEKAYRNYQETGMQRYDRERQKAEDLAEALNAAANAAEEHNTLQSLRAEFNWVAYRADAAIESGNVELMKEILKGVVDYASAMLNYKRIGEVTL